MTESVAYDVVVIGAGPAGAAAAALLAEKGRRVLLLDREKFPRYHIGESLLPFCHYPLERLGLVERMRGSAFVKKYSVQFVSITKTDSHPFYFFNRYDLEVAQTWQVLRSEFDALLAANAVEKGAVFLEETTVVDLLEEAGRVAGVRARRADGTVVEFRAPLTLDCSGRDAVAALRNRWRVRDPKLNKVAVWTYYRGALRDPGIDEGATTVAFVPEKGWFWYIPQHEDRVSVGIVAEASYLMRSGDRDPESIFRREAAACRWIEEHLAPGVQEGPFRMTGEYSFHAQHCAADGLVLAGDAFCFLDPVFSSGLMFALKSGVMAADLIDEALAAGEVGGERFADYGARLRRGIENMRKLVYAFYDPGFSFRELTRKYPELAADVTDCLSGDVDKDFTRLFTAVAEFAAVPDPLALGAPSPSRPRERATR